MSSIATTMMNAVEHPRSAAKRAIRAADAGDTHASSSSASESSAVRSSVERLPALLRLVRWCCVRHGRHHR